MAGEEDDMDGVLACAMGGGWGAAGWLVGGLGMVAFWGVVIGLAIMVLRRWSPGGNRAEQVLAERYARGEIDEVEYRSRLDELHESRSVATSRW